MSRNKFNQLKIEKAKSLLPNGFVAYFKAVLG